MFRQLFAPIADAFKHLEVALQVTNFFDPEERRLALQSFVIGGLVWGVVFILKNLTHDLFAAILHWVEAAPTPVLLLLPLLAGALIVAGLARYASGIIHYRDDDGHMHELIDIEGDGLERAISLYFASEPSFEQTILGKEGVDVRWRMPTFSLAGRKFLATLATLGSGGSGGLEASVTLIGESLAAGIVKPRKAYQIVDPYTLGWSARLTNWWRSTDPDHLQTAQLSGVAAAVSTLLGAPLTAAFFATEIMYRNRPIIEKLVFSLIASLTAFFLTRISSDHVAIFHVDNLPAPPENLSYYAVLVLVGIVVSLISVYFGRLRSSFDEAFHHRQPNIWRRHLIGAAFAGLVALLFYWVSKWAGWTEEGLSFVLGPGEHAIDLAMAGKLSAQLAFMAIFAKIVATLATVGSGGSAGLLIPSLYFGAMAAAGLAPLFDLPAIALIVPAMTASLTAIANVPLAAILFTAEMFGVAYMAPALVTLVVAAIFARENSIYRTQRQKYVQRQIMPGYSSRRLPVPPKWFGKTLVELQFRNRFDVNVVGLLEQEGEDGLPHVRLNPGAEIPLEAGDILVALGKDDDLDKLDELAKMPAISPES